jgi:hypothetical protein
MGTHKTKTTEPLEVDDFERALPDASDRFARYCCVRDLTIPRSSELWRDHSARWEIAESGEYSPMPEVDNRVFEKFDSLCRSSGTVKPKPAAPVAEKDKEQTMSTNTEIFHKLIAKRQADHGESRHVAHMAVCRQHPEIREGYVQEYNNLHGRHGVCRVS